MLIVLSATGVSNQSGKISAFLKAAYGVGDMLLSFETDD